MKNLLMWFCLVVLMTSGLACNTKKDEASQTPPANDGAKTEWIAFDEAMAKAAAEKRFVIIDFSTEWCKWCKVMLAKTYTDPAVVKAIQDNFVAIPIDGESSGQITYLGKTLTQADFTINMKIDGFPTTVFMDDQGNVLEKRAGYIDAPTFLKILKYFTSGEYKKTKLDEYLTASK
jgi:thioredoxin-related protein